jgi:CBS domain-containing protein
VMTPDAFTVGPEWLGIEAVIDMLDRGVRHAPVVGADGTVLGVLDDVDLLAAEGRTPFHLRRTIAEAPSVDALVAAGAELPRMLVALFDAGVAPGRVSAIETVVIDALTRRLLDLAVAGLGPAPAPFSWLALGSLGRREALPSSDADTGLVWHGDDRDPEIRRWMGDLAARVVAGLVRCGLAPDDHGVRADMPLFARSADAWRAGLESWIADPAQEQALIAVSVLFDGRVVAGEGAGQPVATWLAPEARRPATLRLLARLALAHRPPTGFLRDIVVEHSGAHRGALDIKRGGALPIVDLARWAGITAGASDPGTSARLAVAARAGVLSPDDARTLTEAWDLVAGLRLEHQIGQVRAGRAPDDHLRPDTLNPLTRRYLREAFRAVAAVQKHVSNELSFGTGA